MARLGLFEFIPSTEPAFVSCYQETVGSEDVLKERAVTYALCEKCFATDALRLISQIFFTYVHDLVSSDDCSAFFVVVIPFVIEQLNCLSSTQ